MIGGFRDWLEKHDGDHKIPLYRMPYDMPGTAAWLALQRTDIPQPKDINLDDIAGRTWGSHETIDDLKLPLMVQFKGRYYVVKGYPFVKDAMLQKKKTIHTMVINLDAKIPASNDDSLSLPYAVTITPYATGTNIDTRPGRDPMAFAI